MLVVALATNAGMPTANITGNPISIPPPAMAFMEPTRMPTKNKMISCMFVFAFNLFSVTRILRLAAINPMFFEEADSQRR